MRPNQANRAWQDAVEQSDVQQDGAATVRAFAGFINACGLIDIRKHALNTNGDFDSDALEPLVSRAFACYKSKDKNILTGQFQDIEARGRVLPAISKTS